MEEQRAWRGGTDCTEGFPLLSFSFSFLRRYGGKEIREPRFDGRAPHGFAECRSGTGLGYVLRKP